jgi:uncharacterized protein YkwD
VPRPHKKEVGLKSWIPIVAAALVVALMAAVLIVRLSPPSYTTAGAGLALGPAVRHSPSPSDFAAQAATSALTAAAGSATNQLADLAIPPVTPQEQALLDLTNADRASNGLPPVIFDQETLWVARARAAAQVPGGPLSHYDSLGELAFVGLLQDANVSYALAGENLARGSGLDINLTSRLNDALMNSPEHRANILEPSFNRLAVGAASFGSDSSAFAEIFRSASDQPAPPAEAT